MSGDRRRADAGVGGGAGDGAGERVALPAASAAAAAKAAGSRAAALVSARLAGGQRAGLVEDDGVDGGELLQRLAVLEEDALAEEPARGGGQDGRHGEAEARRGR